jgi:esterase/lipase
MICLTAGKQEKKTQEQMEQEIKDMRENVKNLLVKIEKKKEQLKDNREYIDCPVLDMNKGQIQKNLDVSPEEANNIYSTCVNKKLRLYLREERIEIVEEDE